MPLHPEKVKNAWRAEPLSNWAFSLHSHHLESLLGKDEPSLQLNPTPTPLWPLWQSSALTLLKELRLPGTMP